PQAAQPGTAAAPLSPAARTNLITRVPPAGQGAESGPASASATIVRRPPPRTAAIGSAGAGSAGAAAVAQVRAIPAKPQTKPQNPAASRTSLARMLLPADQTQQIKMVPGASPAAKILREVQ
ncbi:MAG: hypothetical protein LBF22_12655, partial [Deltaproteobacteria bacterium]|nr:hypothetical protein [Deltaproteobacteria bacterium]